MQNQELYAFEGAQFRLSRFQIGTKRLSTFHKSKLVKQAHRLRSVDYGTMHLLVNSSPIVLHSLCVCLSPSKNASWVYVGWYILLLKASDSSRLFKFFNTVRARRTLEYHAINECKWIGLIESSPAVALEAFKDYRDLCMKATFTIARDVCGTGGGLVPYRLQVSKFNAAGRITQRIRSRMPVDS